MGESPCNSRQPEGRREQEEDKSQGDVVIVLENPAELSVPTLLKDVLTSWWSHSVWCHEFRLIHAATEVPLSELLIGSAESLRQFWFTMLSFIVLKKDTTIRHCCTGRVIPPAAAWFKTTHNLSQFCIVDTSDHKEQFDIFRNLLIHFLAKS